MDSVQSINSEFQNHCIVILSLSWAKYRDSIVSRGTCWYPALIYRNKDQIYENKTITILQVSVGVRVWVSSGHVINIRVRKHQICATLSIKVCVCPCERCTSVAPVSSQFCLPAFLDLPACWQWRAGGPRLHHVLHAALCHMPSLSRRSRFYLFCILFSFCSLHILYFF